MQESTYQWVVEQVEGMLATAMRIHQDFQDDCLHDPFQIPRHWDDRVIVRRNKQNSDEAASTDDNTDPAGFCVCSEQSGGRYLLVVNECGYPPRDYFTLLHELGHYLQHTDLDLWMRLYVFDDKATAKEAEETACNLFASKALMPDYLIDRVRENSWKADVAAKLYQLVRASRPAVVRRIAPLLPSGAWLTMVDREQDEMKVRAYSNWSQEYGDLLDVERLALRRFRKGHTGNSTIAEQTFTDVSGKDRQGRYTISVALSPSSTQQPFWFILGQRQPGE